MSSDRGRHAALDLVRFCASAMVVVNHYVYSHDALGPLAFLRGPSSVGYLGVDFFFIISGIVIVWTARGRAARTFVSSRLLRLYPEFWVSVLVTAAVFGAFPELVGREIGLRTILLNLTMVPQYLGAAYVDGVYWTLGVELKFYALVWLLIVTRQFGRIERWLYAWIAAEAAVFLFGIRGPLAALVIHPYGPLLAAGGLFALVSDSGWSRWRIAALATALVLAITQAVASIPDFVRPADLGRAQQVATALVMVAGFGIVAWIVGRRAPELRFASLFSALGRLTYPLYLLHNVGKVLFIAALPLLPSYIGITLAVVFALALSWGVERASFLVIRPRLRALLDRIPLLHPPAATPGGRVA